jgi:hypothetical protein
MQTYRDYRDTIRPRGIMPMRVVRTVKRPGDVVLHSWAKPVEKLA